MFLKLQEKRWCMFLWLPLSTLTAFLAIWFGLVSQVYGGWILRYDEAPNWGILSLLFSLIFVLLLAFLRPRKQAFNTLSISVSVTLLFWLFLAFILFRAIQEMKFELVSTQTQRAQFAQKSDLILNSLNKVCQEQHLTFIGPSTLNVSNYRDKQEPGTFNSAGSSVILSDKDQRFSFCCADGRFVQYINDLEFSQVLEPIYDKPDVPKWTAAQAIQIATAFKNIFTNGTSDYKLGPPQARYSHSGHVGKKTSRGNWSVTWNRVDRDGHYFYLDYLTMNIPEDFGPAGVTACTFTPFVEEQGKPMSVQDALPRVRNSIFWEDPLAAGILKIVGINSYWSNIVDYKLLSQNLMVVTPNHPLLWTNCGGRLAWVFWFRPIHNGGRAMYDDDFAVFVDAYTGEILGGDAVLQLISHM